MASVNVERYWMQELLQQPGLSHARGNRNFSTARLAGVSASPKPVLPLQPAQYLAAFPQLGTPSLRNSLSHSLYFVTRAFILEAVTCPRLWRRRELHLLGQNLLAVSVPLG